MSSCDIVACPFSDHCAVVMSVRVPEVPSHGPGVWKLNLSVLNDPEYISLFSNFWSDWRAAQPRFPTLAKWWDKGKSIIKGLTIRYCCVRSSQRSQHRSLLSRLADHLKCRVDAGFISCLGPYRSTLAKIARMDIEVARGAQVRAGAYWMEEGETSSAFFLRLEKKRAADRSVAALRTNDGSIVSHNDDLCRVFSSFYESLFTAEATNPAIANSLLSNVSSTLPSTQADLCDGPLSSDECFAALKGMARDKSPGSDGLPMEFGLHVSQYCFCGPVLESLSHLLFSCPLAQIVLSWLQSLMFRYSPMSPVLLLRHVLFGFNLDELRTLPRVFVYILNVCKFCIWLARNDFRFRSLQPGAIPVVESAKARVKFHLTVSFKHQRTARRRRFFTRRWGANGVIASFAGGNLTFAS